MALSSMQDVLTLISCKQEFQTNRRNLQNPLGKARILNRYWFTNAIWTKILFWIVIIFCFLTFREFYNWNNINAFGTFSFFKYLTQTFLVEKSVSYNLKEGFLANFLVVRFNQNQTSFKSFIIIIFNHCLF